MKHSVRIAAALAAASLSVGLVAGCGGSDSSSGSAADTTAAAATDTTATAAVDTTAVGTDVGMAINDACKKFETDGAAAVVAGDATAFVSAFDAYKTSVADAANGASGDANATAYLDAVNAAEAEIQSIKTEVDGGATLADALDKVDSTSDDDALSTAAKAGGYDSCVELHLEGS